MRVFIVAFENVCRHPRELSLKSDMQDFHALRISGYYYPAWLSLVMADTSQLSQRRSVLPMQLCLPTTLKPFGRYSTIVGSSGPWPLILDKPPTTASPQLGDLRYPLKRLYIVSSPLSAACRLLRSPAHVELLSAWKGQTYSYEHDPCAPKCSYQPLSASELRSHRRKSRHQDR